MELEGGRGGKSEGADINRETRGEKEIIKNRLLEIERKIEMMLGKERERKWWMRELEKARKGERSICGEQLREGKRE